MRTPITRLGGCLRVLGVACLLLIGFVAVGLFASSSFTGDEGECETGLTYRKLQAE